jgi:hypothetical protein
MHLKQYSEAEEYARSALAIPGGSEVLWSPVGFSRTHTYSHAACAHRYQPLCLSLSLLLPEAIFKQHTMHFPAQLQQADTPLKC